MTIPAISPQSFLGNGFPAVGGLNGAPSSGLFGSFMGDFLGVLTEAAGLEPTDIGANADPLLALLGLDEGQTIEDLPPEFLAEDGQPDLNAIADHLFGDDRPAGDVQAIRITLIQVVTVVYSEAKSLQSAGIPMDNLNDVDALAAAYVNQGYEPAEAQAKAESVVAIMKALDAQIQRIKEMLAALRDGTPLAGYVLAANDASVSPFGFGNAQVSYAAFRSVSVTTTSYTDLTARVLSGAPLTREVPQQNTAAVLADAASAAANENSLLPTDVDPTLDDAQLAKLVESAEHILQAAAKAENSIAKGEAGIAAIAQREALGSAKTAAGDRSVPADVAIAANAPIKAKAPVTETENVVAETEGVDALLEADLAAEPADQARSGTNDREVRRDDARLTQRPQQDVESVSLRADTQRTASLDAQTTPIDSTAATPVYKVETSPTGGVQLVNAATGQVVSSDVSTPSDTPRAAATPDTRMADLIAQARVIQQVRVHVRTVANHGGGRIDVAINPPELGRVEVNLRIKEGKVSGTITVQRPEVMEHLARELKVLEQGLADAGLTVAKEGLTFQLQEQGSQGQQGGNSRQAANGGGFSGDGGENGNAAENALWLDPERLIDLNV